MKPLPEVDESVIAERVATMHRDRTKAAKAAREREHERQRAREQREAGQAANARASQSVANLHRLEQLRAAAWAREAFAAEQAGAVDPSAPAHVDVAALLEAGLTARKPDAGAVRSDGERMLYSGTVNGLVGLPEAGKGLAATANTVDELRLGGRVLWVDADSNGAGAIVEKLLAAGIETSVLGDATRLRVVEAESAEAIRIALAQAAEWSPTLVVIDSVTELIGMLGGNPNIDVDYIAAHNEFLRPFRNLGAAVLAIDHEAKTAAGSGFASGSTQKKAKIDGAYYRVAVLEQFRPLEGGSSVLTILKDRHGGVRATTPSTRAAVFKLDSRGGAFTWEFWRGRADEESAASSAHADVAFVLALAPIPTTVRELQAAIRAKNADGKGWRDNRARDALKAARDRADNLTTFPITETES